MLWLIMGLFVVAGIAIIIVGSMPKKEQKSKQNKLFKKLYKFFSRFFLTQMYIAKIYGKLANLSIYRREELQHLAVKYLLISWGIGGGLILSSFFLFQDFLTTLIVILFGCLVSNIVVDKQLDAMQIKVTKALSHALSNIRQEYMRTNSIVEALSDAEIPSIVKKPIEDIANMLNSNNAELKLQEFCEATPFRTVQTLAGICFHINNQGDEKDVHGQSNFIQAMTILISEVNSDIQKTMYRKKVFGNIEYLPFLPIFAMGFLESYFMSIMPGTALIYNGTIGYIFRTITVLSAVIAYVTISRINTTIPIKEDDRGDWVVTLLERPTLKRFIRTITPKNKAKLKVENNLKNAISRMTLDQFYMKKVVSAVVTFSLAILCIISAVTLGKEFVTSSTQQLSVISTDEMKGYTKDTILAMDNLYLKDPSSYNDQQLNDLVSSNMSGLSDLQIQDQVKRLKTKANSIENAYFKWWYIWVAVVIAYIGWLGPNMLLMLRKKLIETEEEDDFLQLQTLVSILMNTNIDTLDMLHELAQHSRVHKDMFLYAYQGYPSNPELELTRLQAKTPLLEFKRFIGKLKLSISDLSLQEAYSDLLIEREHIIRLRDMTTQESIDRKRGICGPLSMTPLACMVVGEFLVPLGILGYNEFMTALSSL